jgi:cell division septation protein DedD
MNKSGGGSDTVLESRHVVGMFLAVVVLCGIFFTLGWVMGRTQYESSVMAARSVAEKPVAAPKPVEHPPANDWNFLRATESAQPPEKLEPAPAPAESAPPPVEPLRAPAETKPKSSPTQPATSKLFKAPVIPRGAVVLQVAALRSEADALALAEALQQKEFPAYVLTPESSGGLFRVQVGPYTTAKSADAAKKSLEREGFKAITKR